MPIHHVAPFEAGMWQSSCPCVQGLNHYTAAVQWFAFLRGRSEGPVAAGLAAHPAPWFRQNGALM
jgi:hypothetical protein